MLTYILCAVPLILVWLFLACWAFTLYDKRVERRLSWWYFSRGGGTQWLALLTWPVFLIWFHTVWVKE